MKPFHFKQFSIEQDQCAMKVTLDACVLGAFCDVADSSHILDIGAGTGLLSLMVAQRTGAKIAAIELDPLAAAQAAKNVANSSFSDRISVIQGDVLQNHWQQSFDRIVCNPPFFSDHLKGPNNARNQARHNDGLSFDDLLAVCHQVLTQDGQAWFILPCHEFPEFIAAAKNKGFLLANRLTLKSRTEKPAHREIFSLVKTYCNEPVHQELVIHDQHNQYSEHFKRLLKPYYLKL